MNLERLELLRNAARNLGNQAESSHSALLPYFQAQYQISLIFVFHYTSERYYPSALYDNLLPDFIAWVSFIFSHPTLSAKTPKLLALSSRTLVEILRHQGYRNSFYVKYPSVLEDAVSCWVFLCAEALALVDSPTPEAVFNIRAFPQLFMSLLEANPEDTLSSRLEATIEARADDVARSCVGVIVKCGVADVGDSRNVITGEWFASLRLLCILANLSRMQPALHAHDAINVVCRLMRRFARFEIPVVEIPVLGALMRNLLLCFEELLRGPLAAMEALQAQCLPTLLRMHASFSQTRHQSVTSPKAVDESIVSIMRTIRGYSQIPSFQKVIRKSVRRIEQMRGAETGALIISGKVADEYTMICRYLELTATMHSRMSAKASWCAARWNCKRWQIDEPHPGKYCGGCKAVVYCSSECQRWHWVEGNHRVHCLPLQRSQFLTSPYNPLGYIDLATVVFMASARLQVSPNDWIRTMDPSKHVLIDDLATGLTQVDDLQKILRVLTFRYSDMGHWNEIAKRRVPRDPTSPYILLTIGDWPLELTNLERLVGNGVDVELYDAPQSTP
ncbi:hypothetical protein CYLTODRAFT_443287 [Cylindrobasidium torrendii FP15055 ss-10]|uniref:MYND-type domain-containing protein n=1 Tax=Cylindrobasidium torrendii FP15055 ss-10 TaxID=1314674 RepID=A0A0D7BDJ2_9AGAR|nr:hypothetical protein CYLTODRAFT_443287 [Cylindrobasidium torrendii FP15055 ss-10]